MKRRKGQGRQALRSRCCFSKLQPKDPSKLVPPENVIRDDARMGVW